MLNASIPASQVIVIAGSPGYIAGPLGTNEAHDARIALSPNFIGHAAADAGLCTVDPHSGVDHPVFRHQGNVISLGEIESRWGESLRANTGIRLFPEGRFSPDTERIGAPLAHNLEAGGQPGGLRHRAGLTQERVAASALAPIAPNFSDDPALKMPVVHDLFVASMAMALAPLERPLSEIVPDATQFRVWASSALPGIESYDAMGRHVQDDGAMRLAGFLSSHGANLVTMALSPSLPLDEVKLHPEMVEEVLRGGSLLYGVPQTPLVSSDACASVLVSFCNGVWALRTQDALDRIDFALWSGADTPVIGDGRINEGFSVPLVKTRTLAPRKIPPAEALRPFDTNMLGTVAGDLGGAFCVTTLEFAMRHFLDVVALVPGWGQSNESGGKKMMGGVGYCGGNATRTTFLRAQRDHGFGVNNFKYWNAHGTGTIVNSLTDMGAMNASRKAVAEAQGQEALIQMVLGAIKALVAHNFGAAGVPMVRECIKYVSGQTVVGVPNFTRFHIKIPQADASSFIVSPNPHQLGSSEGGAIATVQGFGGPNGAMAFYTANRDTISRYAAAAGVREAYFERWDEVRRESQRREIVALRTEGSALEQLVRHRWQRRSHG